MMFDEPGNKTKEDKENVKTEIYMKEKEFQTPLDVQLPYIQDNCKDTQDIRKEIKVMEIENKHEYNHNNDELAMVSTCLSKDSVGVETNICDYQVTSYPSEMQSE